MGLELRLLKAAIELQTERLKLKVLEPSDVSWNYVSWLNDKEINQYLETRWETHSLESVRDYVRSLSVSDGDVLFGVFSQLSSHKHIGNIKLSKIDKNHHTAEIGFLIGEKAYWGRGLASEAIGCVCSWALNTLGIKKINAGSYGQNQASIRTLEKIGFELEGILRSQVRLNTHSRDDLLRYGMIQRTRHELPPEIPRGCT